MNHENKQIVRIRVSAIIFEKGKFLLVKHRKNDKEYWLLPGGGQKFCESFIDTIQRELVEELNISAESYKFLFIRETFNTDQRHIVFPIFLAIKPELNNIKVGSDERVVAYDWISAEDLFRITLFPDIKEDLISFARNGLIIPYKKLQWISLE